MQRLVFAGQQDHVIREEEGDFCQREVGEAELLGINDMLVAILTDECGSSIGLHRELPVLERLSGDLRFHLSEGDFIDQPVSACGVSHIFDAIGIENVAIEGVSVPVFGSGELAQIRFFEGCGFLSHGLCSFVDVTPTAGAKVQRRKRIAWRPYPQHGSVREWSGQGVGGQAASAITDALPRPWVQNRQEKTEGDRE